MKRHNTSNAKRYETKVKTREKKLNNKKYKLQIAEQAMVEEQLSESELSLYSESSEASNEEPTVEREIKLEVNDEEEVNQIQKDEEDNATLQCTPTLQKIYEEVKSRISVFDNTFDSQYVDFESIIAKEHEKQFLSINDEIINILTFLELETEEILIVFDTIRRSQELYKLLNNFEYFRLEEVKISEISELHNSLKEEPVMQFTVEEFNEFAYENNIIENLLKKNEYIKLILCSTEMYFRHYNIFECVANHYIDISCLNSKYCSFFLEMTINLKHINNMQCYYLSKFTVEEFETLVTNLHENNENLKIVTNSLNPLIKKFVSNCLFIDSTNECVNEKDNVILLDFNLEILSQLNYLTECEIHFFMPYEKLTKIFYNITSNIIKKEDQEFIEFLYLLNNDKVIQRIVPKHVYIRNEVVSSDEIIDLLENNVAFYVKYNEEFMFPKHTNKTTNHSLKQGIVEYISLHLDLLSSISKQKNLKEKFKEFNEQNVTEEIENELMNCDDLEQVLEVCEYNSITFLDIDEYIKIK